jgi:hypothetical protein
MWDDISELFEIFTYAAGGFISWIIECMFLLIGLGIAAGILYICFIILVLVVSF